MALVKILAGNIFAGANFQKLEVGTVYDIEDTLAKNWIENGQAEASNANEGESLTFEVASPSSASGNAELMRELALAKHHIAELEDQSASLPVLSDELAEANEKITELTTHLEESNAKLAAITSELESLKASKKGK